LRLGIVEGYKVLREYHITEGRIQTVGRDIHKDIKAYPNSGFSDIHQRIGTEINIFKVRRILKNMVDKGELIKEGDKRGAKYFIKQIM